MKLLLLNIAFSNFSDISWLPVLMAYDIRDSYN